ncbi:hypothetical protein HMPREF0495_02217 [Levilactobacillus brevis ATCC 14869 = DSM 20054]|uniref:Uncharacterized protein n=1 Tax=Levilactobacillus brevis ATCC 14869 = DSM 20054 TaxID=649758 RepID=U2QJI6_LEVBR|nr:hypothetical protein HMPREF0495_02217 [Levilactobacillus brevis ATCC 14869 = DSM 20054]
MFKNIQISLSDTPSRKITQLLGVAYNLTIYWLKVPRFRRI